MFASYIGELRPLAVILFALLSRGKFRDYVSPELCATMTEIAQAPRCNAHIYKVSIDMISDAMKPGEDVAARAKSVD